MTRDEFVSAYDVFYRVVCGFSVGELEPEFRHEALGLLGRVRDEIVHGLDRRDGERRDEEDRRILKAYREGRLIEAQK